MDWLFVLSSIFCSYAPDDPTLPKPWKGLIDGKSGDLYYWNPETNFMQYEKSVALPPPLSAGPQNTPNLAPSPGARMIQPNGASAQYEQQMAWGSGRGEVPCSSQMDVQQQPHVAQHGAQVGSAMQHQGHVKPQHVRTQMMAQPTQQMFPYSDQQKPPPTRKSNRAVYPSNVTDGAPDSNVSRQ